MRKHTTCHSKIESSCKLVGNKTFKIKLDLQNANNPKWFERSTRQNDKHQSNQCETEAAMP